MSLKWDKYCKKNLNLVRFGPCGCKPKVAFQKWRRIWIQSTYNQETVFTSCYLWNRKIESMHCTHFVQEPFKMKLPLVRGRERGPVSPPRETHQGPERDWRERRRPTGFYYCPPATTRQNLVWLALRLCWRPANWFSTIRTNNNRISILHNPFYSL